MDIVIGLALNRGLPLAIVFAMHRWIGPYPNTGATAANHPFVS